MAVSRPMIAMSRMSPTLGGDRQETLRGSSGLRQEPEPSVVTNCAVSQSRPRATRERVKTVGGRQRAPARPARGGTERNRFRITESASVLEPEQHPGEPSVARVARQERPAGLRRADTEQLRPVGRAADDAPRTTMSAASTDSGSVNRSATSNDAPVGDARPTGRARPARTRRRRRHGFDDAAARRAAPQRARPGSDRSRRRSRRRSARRGRPPRPMRRSAWRRRHRGRPSGSGAARAALPSLRRCRAGRRRGIEHGRRLLW